MLVQLAIYALSQEGVREAVILYPSVGGSVSEQVVEIREPSYGDQRARVILRAVNLRELAEAVECRGVRGERWRGDGGGVGVGKEAKFVSLGGKRNAYSGYPSRIVYLCTQVGRAGG
jgi:hypothetical protein